MKRFNIEMGVGIFLIAGFLSFFYISIKLGGVGLFGDNTYSVKARFVSISGLKEGAFVEIAGVRVGKVTSISLDPRNYEALVYLSINSNVRLQEDSIASIRTNGLIGDKYVEISPGGSEDYLQPGSEIQETESAISLEKLVSKYIFGKE